MQNCRPPAVSDPPQGLGRDEFPVYEQPGLAHIIMGQDEMLYRSIRTHIDGLHGGTAISSTIFSSDPGVEPVSLSTGATICSVPEHGVYVAEVDRQGHQASGSTLDQPFRSCPYLEAERLALTNRVNDLLGWPHALYNRGFAVESYAARYTGRSVHFQVQRREDCRSIEDRTDLLLERIERNGGRIRLALVFGDTGRARCQVETASGRGNQSPW